jgi:hypothetical protein
LHTFEKTLISEVVGLFLGNPFNPDNAGRKLERGFMRTLEYKITTTQD